MKYFGYIKLPDKHIRVPFEAVQLSLVQEKYFKALKQISVSPWQLKQLVDENIDMYMQGQRVLTLFLINGKSINSD